MAHEQSCDRSTHLRSEQTDKLLPCSSEPLSWFTAQSSLTVVAMSFSLTPALLDGGSCPGVIGAALLLEEAACSPLPGEAVVWWGHSELNAIQITFFFSLRLRGSNFTNILGKRPQAPAACGRRLTGNNQDPPVTAALHRLLPQLSYRDWFTLQEQSINPWSFSFTPIKSFFLHDNIHFLAEWILSYGILSEAAQKVETKDQQM